MKLVTTLFAIALSLYLAGASPYRGRVIDGTIVEDSVAFLVSITENTEHICNGFIYSPGWVITAASCVSERQTTPLKVVVNERSLIAEDPDEVSIAVYQIFIKDGYNSTTKVNDVALLKLASNISTPPATCIRYDEVLPSFGKDGWLVGWGTNIEPNGSASARSYNATLDVLSNNRTCEGYANFNAATMICVNVTKGVPCTHDEGAPLVMHATTATDQLEPVAVGIYSYNTECRSDMSSIFTRLSAFYSWFINIAGRQPTDCFKAAR